MDGGASGLHHELSNVMGIRAAAEEKGGTGEVAGRETRGKHEN